MADDQRVEASPDLAAQPLSISWILGRPAPDTRPGGHAFRWQPLPLSQTLQSLARLADQVLIVDRRVATHQHTRARAHATALGAGLTWLPNSDMPSSDGKSRNHSMKCEMPRAWYASIWSAASSGVPTSQS